MLRRTRRFSGYAVAFFAGILLIWVLQEPRPNGGRRWSAWGFASIGALALSLLIVEQRARRVRDPLLCPACGYDRRGLEDGALCPECGRAPQPG
jgi:hypothetical protein